MGLWAAPRCRLPFSSLRLPLPILSKSALYFLSFLLYSSVKNLPEVFHSTTRSLQRKQGPFYCKMSRLESLPSAVQHEERKLNKEKKLKPTHSKASEDGQEVPQGQWQEAGELFRKLRARSWWPNCHQLSGAPPPAAPGDRALWCPLHEVLPNRQHKNLLLARWWLIRVRMGACESKGLALGCSQTSLPL